MKVFQHIGSYLLLMLKVFNRPEKTKIFHKQVMREFFNVGVNSIYIVVLISFFMGAVITIQTALNLENPLIPKFYVGLGTRDSMILEFSSTMVALILAGKVGSNIASEIGSMRITEQIDALEIMGINSANYLILPKVMALMLFIPVLTVISIFIGIFGGWIATISTNLLSTSDFHFGIRYAFQPYYVTYTLIKSVVFAFIITTISSYHGYFVRGGALEVGNASTKAVVSSSIVILLFNLILTKILLA